MRKCSENVNGAEAIYYLKGLEFAEEILSKYKVAENILFNDLQVLENLLRMVPESKPEMVANKTAAKLNKLLAITDQNQQPKLYEQIKIVIDMLEDDGNSTNRSFIIVDDHGKTIDLDRPDRIEQNRKGAKPNSKLSQDSEFRHKPVQGDSLLKEKSVLLDLSPEQSTIKDVSPIDKLSGQDSSLNYNQNAEPAPIVEELTFDPVKPANLTAQAGNISPPQVTRKETNPEQQRVSAAKRLSNVDEASRVHAFLERIPQNVQKALCQGRIFRVYGDDNVCRSMHFFLSKNLTDIKCKHPKDNHVKQKWIIPVHQIREIRFGYDKKSPIAKSGSLFVRPPTTDKCFAIIGPADKEGAKNIHVACNNSLEAKQWYSLLTTVFEEYKKMVANNLKRPSFKLSKE